MAYPWILTLREFEDYEGSNEGSKLKPRTNTTPLSAQGLRRFHATKASSRRSFLAQVFISFERLNPLTMLRERGTQSCVRNAPSCSAETPLGT
jgi:hypothetical protein